MGLSVRWVAASHAVVLALALMASVSVACLVAAAGADGLVGGLTRRTVRYRHRRLDRRLRSPRHPVRVPRARPSIEWIAADLRRLDRHRNGLARESRAWHAAVLRAYDDRLQLASACLGVTEDLAGLEGLDREAERLRVESKLQAAGLVLRFPVRGRTDRP